MDGKVIFDDIYRWLFPEKSSLSAKQVYPSKKQ